MAPFFGLLAIAVAMVLTPRCFPSQDGPLHLYYSDVVSDLLFHGGSNYGAGFIIRHSLTPYVLHTYILVAFNSVFEPLLSEKLLVCVYVVSFCLGFRYLTHILTPKDEVVPLISFLFVFNRFIYWGFYNFCLGLSMALWAAGLWLRLTDDFTWKRLAGSVAWLGLLAITHPVALGSYLLFAGTHLVLWLAMLTLRNPGGTFLSNLRAVLRARRWLALYLFVAAGCVLWVLGFASGQTSMIQAGDTLRIRISNSLFMWAITPVLSRTYRWLYVLIFVLVAGCAVWSFLRLRERARPPAGLSVPLFGCLGMALSVAMPPTLGGGGAVGPRLALFSLLLLSAGAGMVRLPHSVRRVVCVLAVIVALADFSVLARLVQNAQAKQAAFLDAPPPASPGLGAVWVAGPRVPPSALNCEPELWAGAHYVRRSKAVLLNYCWLKEVFMPLSPRKQTACANTNPDQMAACLAGSSGAAFQKGTIGLVVARSSDATKLADFHGLSLCARGGGDVTIYSKAPKQ